MPGVVGQLSALLACTKRSGDSLSVTLTLRMSVRRSREIERSPPPKEPCVTVIWCDSTTWKLLAVVFRLLMSTSQRVQTHERDAAALLTCAGEVNPSTI